jgi:hypothetical protein
MSNTLTPLDSDPPQGSNDSLNESTFSIGLLESSLSLCSSQKKSKLSLQKNKKQVQTTDPSCRLPQGEGVITGSKNNKQTGAQYSRLDGDLEGPSFEPMGMLEAVQTPFNISKGFVELLVKKCAAGRSPKPPLDWNFIVVCYKILVTKILHFWSNF